MPLHVVSNSVFASTRSLLCGFDCVNLSLLPTKPVTACYSRLKYLELDKMRREKRRTFGAIAYIGGSVATDLAGVEQNTRDPSAIS